EFAQDVIQSTDFALHWSGRVAAILEAAASVKRAKIYVIRPGGNALMSRSEAIVENHNTRQMRDIFLQNAEGVRVRFKSENFGVGELAVKIKNRSTNVAADVENDLRSDGRRDIILCFLTALEQNLVENKWIGAA